MIDVRKAASRSMGVAAQLVGHNVDEAAYYGKLVVLTGQPEALSGQGGQWCFLDAVRLLVRVVGRLIIHIPEGAESIEGLVRTIFDQARFRPDQEIVVGPAEDKLLGADAVLSVGHLAHAPRPWISIASTGWVARISSNGAVLENDFSQPNPISALFAASIGVSEVFRRLIGVSTARIPELGIAEFSLFDLSTPEMSRGPDLPAEIQLPGTLLVGAGAIGNGIALLATQLPLHGTWLVVDKQDYADENMGTCVVMAKQGWVGEEKATKLSQWIKENSCLDVDGEKALIADAIGGEKCRRIRPSLLLNGLDDVRARHDAQMVWPNVTIDGGIGEFGLAVVQHRLDDRQLACLRCAFQLPARDHMHLQQSATGLDEQSLLKQDRMLTDDDINRADPARREWLSAKRNEGKTICSVVSEAALERLGADAPDGFRPSVPFVATAAAALMMAEAVKATCFTEATYRQRSIIGNLFLGRESIDFLNQPANASCICVVHRAAILRLQEVRGGA